MKSIALVIFGILFYQSSHSQWTQQTSNTTFNLNDVFFVSNDTGIAVGDNGRIAKTTNGGTNWTTTNAIPTCNLNSVFFATSDSGWIAGTCGIYFSKDGGLNWTLQTAGNGQELNDVFFSGAKFGWAVGNKLTTMRTINGGLNWIIDTLNSTLTNNPLLTVYFKDKNNGWLGGGIKLHYTIDGGQNWIQGSSFLIDWLYSLDFGDTNTGIGSGMIGSTTNTFNWGSNWASIGSTTPNRERIYGVNFSSVDSVYMVGEDGVILFSNNSGSTWSSQTSGVLGNLKGVNFPSTNLGYAVGDAGTIIKYGQSTGIDNKLGAKASFNIYPNPTTGLLNITSIDDADYSLFSVVGKKVVQNGKLQNRLTTVDINNLEKGLYILRIKTDHTGIVTKRIIKH